MDTRWMKNAIEENRICPQCTRPVPKKYWKTCVEQGHCYQCHIGSNWHKGLGAGGSSKWDNRNMDSDRESKF